MANKKKRLINQILKNQICETCIKKLDDTCHPSHSTLTCKRWNDYRLDELGFLAVIMVPGTTKTIKFKEWNFIRRVKIFNLEGFKIGECDQQDFKVGPEDALAITLHA